MSWKCADKKTELSSACWPDSKILNGLPKKHWFPTTFTCNLAQLKYLTFAWLRKWNGLEEILTDDGWMNAQADQYPQDQLTLLEKSSSIQICACMKAVFLLFFNLVYYCGLLFFFSNNLHWHLFICYFFAHLRRTPRPRWKSEKTQHQSQIHRTQSSLSASYCWSQVSSLLAGQNHSSAH